jgi:hypothetical protein
MGLGRVGVTAMAGCTRCAVFSVQAGNKKCQRRDGGGGGGMLFALKL